MSQQTVHFKSNELKNRYLAGIKNKRERIKKRIQHNLFFTRTEKQKGEHKPPSEQFLKNWYYSMILATTPAPTV